MLLDSLLSNLLCVFVFTFFGVTGGDLSVLKPMKELMNLKYKSPQIPQISSRSSLSQVFRNLTHTEKSTSSNGTYLQKNSDNPLMKFSYDFYSTYKTTFDSIIKDYHLPTGSTLGLKSLKNRIEGKYKESKSKKVKAIPECKDEMFKSSSTFHGLCRRPGVKKLTYLTSKNYKRGFKFRSIYSGVVKLENSILSKIIKTYSCALGTITGTSLCSVGKQFESYTKLLSESLIITLNEIDSGSTSDRLLKISRKFFQKINDDENYPINATLFTHEGDHINIKDLLDQSDIFHNEVIFTHAIFKYPGGESVAFYMNKKNEDFGISMIFPQKVLEDQIEDFRIRVGHDSKKVVQNETMKIWRESSSAKDELGDGIWNEPNTKYLQIQQYIDTSILQKLFNKFSINETITRKVLFNVEEQLSIGAFLTDIVSAKVIYEDNKASGATFNTPLTKFRVAIQDSAQHGVIW